MASVKAGKIILTFIGMLLSCNCCHISQYRGIALPLPGSEDSSVCTQVSEQFISRSSRKAQHIPYNFISSTQFSLLQQIRQPHPTRLLDHLKTFSHQVRQHSRNNWHHPSMLGTVISPVNIEDKT